MAVANLTRNLDAIKTRTFPCIKLNIERNFAINSLLDNSNARDKLNRIFYGKLVKKGKDRV